MAFNLERSTELWAAYHSRYIFWDRSLDHYSEIAKHLNIPQHYCLVQAYIIVLLPHSCVLRPDMQGRVTLSEMIGTLLNFFLNNSLYLSEAIALVKAELVIPQ